MQKAIQEAKKMIEESINDKTRTWVHIEVQVLEKLIERLEKLQQEEAWIPIEDTEEKKYQCSWCDALYTKEQYDRMPIAVCDCQRWLKAMV